MADTAVKLTAEQVAELGVKARTAADRAAAAGEQYQRALDGLTVRELVKLARLRGQVVPHGERSRDALLARLR